MYDLLKHSECFPALCIIISRKSQECLLTCEIKHCSYYRARFPAFIECPNNNNNKINNRINVFFSLNIIVNVKLNSITKNNDHILPSYTRLPVDLKSCNNICTVHTASHARYNSSERTRFGKKSKISGKKSGIQSIRLYKRLLASYLLTSTVNIMNHQPILRLLRLISY